MEERLSRSIVRTANTVRRHIDRAVEGMDGVTSGSNARILGYLSAHSNQDIYQKDIERGFSLAKSTVSSALTQLEREGLIRREGVDQDARLRRIALTPKAEEMNRQVYVRLTALEDRIVQGFTPLEMSIFLGYLERVRQNLTQPAQSQSKGGNCYD